MGTSPPELNSYSRLFYILLFLLTNPMKLSSDLADIVGKKEASRAECIKLLWAYLKKNNLHDPENKQYFFPTKRWRRFSVATASALSAWPSSFPLTCPKMGDHLLVTISQVQPTGPTKLPSRP